MYYFQCNKCMNRGMHVYGDRTIEYTEKILSFELRYILVKTIFSLISDFYDNHSLENKLNFYCDINNNNVSIFKLYLSYYFRILDSFICSVLL